MVFAVLQWACSCTGGRFAPVDAYEFEDFEKALPQLQATEQGVQHNRQVMKINVTGVFAVLKYVSKVMVEQPLDVHPWPA